MIDAGSGIFISEEELDEQFVRSGGPGGQNVNKVYTAVRLRFDAAGSPSLPAWVKTRLLLLAGSRATKEGAIVIAADRFRTREENRADALKRLLTLIVAAAKPRVARKATRPTRASKERKLKAKRVRSTVKAGRKAVSADGY